MRKARIVLLVLLTCTVMLLAAVAATAADTVTVPTTATITKGKLIDEYPGPPPRGSTDLDLPFFGVISSESPACRLPRKYEIGKIESSGEFTSIGGTTAPKTGKWTFGLYGKISEPMSVAVRVLPRRTTYQGASYLCEEVISPSVAEDKNDFTPCKVARAGKRGYTPAIRTTRRLIREAKAHNNEKDAAIYRRQLKRFQRYWPSIKRAVQRRCG